VIGAKDELSAQLRQTRKELTTLGRTANDIQRRMENGEQGLQNELEQTRREIGKVTAEHKDLSRKQSEVNREFRDMTTSSRRAGDQMARSMDKAGREMGITNGKAGRLEATTSRMRGGWAKFAGIAAAVTGAVYGASTAFSVLSSSINEARDARKAMAQTAAVMKSMGRTEAPQAVEAMIDQMSRVSGIDDDVLREMTNVLFTFGNVSDDVFTKANELALDLSVSYGKDLNSAAIMVGKALNDPLKGLTALGRVGVQFTQQQQDQIKAMMEVGDVAGAQAIIVEELGKQVGGSAEAQADGIDKATVAWGNLKEAFGEVLLSVSTGSVDIVGSIETITKSVKRNKRDIVSALQGIVSWAFTLVSVWFKVASTWLKLESIVLNGVGYVLGAVSEFTEVLELFGLVDEGTANRIGELADNMRGAGDAAGNTSKKFNDMAGKTGAMGEQMRLARTRADELRDALKKIKDKKVRIDVRTTLNDAFDAVDAAVDNANGVRFAGGPVMPGSSYLVGEIGPELFVPQVGEPRMVGMGGPEIRDFHTSGTIIPTTMVGAYMAANVPQAPATAAAAPSGGVHIENLTVQDRLDARREFQALMARERRIAAERS
jgi:hypothetical protein